MSKMNLKFTDGETVQFEETWDDQTDNSLNNQESQSGDYYLIYEKYVKHRHYELNDSPEPFANHFYKVPKKDIFEIYEISEEIMV